MRKLAQLRKKCNAELEEKTHHEEKNKVLQNKALENKALKRKREEEISERDIIADSKKKKEDESVEAEKNKIENIQHNDEDTVLQERTLEKKPPSENENRKENDQEKAGGDEGKNSKDKEARKLLEEEKRKSRIREIRRNAEERREKQRKSLSHQQRPPQGVAQSLSENSIVVPWEQQEEEEKVTLTKEEERNMTKDQILSILDQSSSDEDSVASLNPVPLLSDQLRRAEALPRRAEALPRRAEALTRRVEPLYLLEEKPDAGLYDPPDPTIRVMIHSPELLEDKKDLLESKTSIDNGEESLYQEDDVMQSSIIIENVTSLSTNQAELVPECRELYGLPKNLGALVQIISDPDSDLSYDDDGSSGDELRLREARRLEAPGDQTDKFSYSLKFEPSCPATYTQPNNTNQKYIVIKADVGMEMGCYNCNEPLDRITNKHGFDLQDKSTLIFCECGKQYRIQPGHQLSIM